jgi:uroporphyrin-III C-methyltransferase/precorrin-2 dehydrogenase/sirohydrochlorin ferrochelatase
MFPIMLHLKGKRCLVVGAGGVALRKVQGLVAEGARVHVVAPEVVPQLEALASGGQITLDKRDYRPGEADGYVLVFAATNRPEVNRVVFEDANRAGVWVNSADDPELCTFHLPARVQRGPFQLAVATAGEAPFATRRIRQLLEHRFGPEWGEWIEAATRFRSRVRQLGLDPSEQEECFDRFFEATVDGGRIAARVPLESEQAAWTRAASVARPRAAVRPRHHVPATGRERRPAGPAPRVSLVGAGPGCAGLLTVRGWQRLMAADVIVYDRLAASALPPELEPRIELHCVGKTAGNHPVPQEQITALLVRLAREGKRTVRLKGGDPYVFGRGGEEAEALRAEGIPFEVIPGVSSGFAASAWAGIPVTHRGEAVRVTLLTAHECIKRKGPQMRWDLLAQDPHATLVGYMGLSTLPQVASSLITEGMDPATPAAMIERGTTAAQRTVISTLEELPERVRSEGLKAPALFVIGPTVRHAAKLDWFGDLPLVGERLVVPGDDPALTRDLEAAGAEIVIVCSPVTPAARVVMGAAPLTGCVLRSPAEVEFLDDERQGPGWEKDPVAWCLDPETAERARQLGWQRVRLVGGGPGGAELIREIGKLEHAA